MKQLEKNIEGNPFIIRFKTPWLNSFYNLML